jgi:2-keto-4-pentenoate hydratase/2-oxohepta-3-ene-1,7-dioic acid hydratase in catechol pathway
MRLITYRATQGDRAGVEVAGRVLDTEALARAAGLPAEAADWSNNRSVLTAGSDMLRRLEASAAGVEPGAEPDVGAVSELELGPPIPDPDKIICLGLNYGDHAREAGATPPEVPVLFAKFRNCLVGPTEPIVLPEASKAVDYEGELAVVIGTRCKNVPEEDALRHVAGGMALNDVSARDLQNQTGQWLSGKAIDTFAPCGPALVTVDELGDLQDLGISTELNGQLVQESNTREMIFSVTYAVAYLSRLMTLAPGDIIATGTPAGIGSTREPPLLLADGDVVSVTVDGVGSLRNPVKAAVDERSGALVGTGA